MIKKMREKVNILRKIFVENKPRNGVPNVSVFYTSEEEVKGF